MQDIIDILLDEENREPIVLVDDNGRKITFEQVAVIPYNDMLYCVLKPVDKIDNIADDEAIVFFVDDNGEQSILVAETDERKAKAVFEEYYKLVEEQFEKENKDT